MNTVFVNNEYINKQDVKISAFDHGFLFGDALYETLLIYNKKLCFFEEHWNRFMLSIQNLRMKLPKYMDTQEKAQKIFETMIEKNSCTRGRIRMTFSRGENNFDFTTCPNPTVIISISPLAEYPKEIYTQGISVKSIFYQRSLPEFKSNNSLASVLGQQEIKDSGDFEGIFCIKNTDASGKEKNWIREGTISNCIAVFEKTIWIPPRETVLPGTMQALVEKILHNDGFVTQEKNFSIQDTQEKNAEVYILNSLFGVVRVVSMDRKKIIEKKSQEFSIYNRYFGKNFFDRYL